MLIAVVSDTHKHIDALQKVLNKTEDADMIIHLGDNVGDAKYLSERFKGKLINVKGNCDTMSSEKNTKIEIIEGKKFFITHGHNYDVKYDLIKLKYKALEANADIVLFGHTHASEVLFEEGIWFINPGSAAEARDRSNSIAVIEINDNDINVNLRII